VINQNQEIYQPNIGLNKLFLLIKIDSLINYNSNHYELLCKEKYELIQFEPIGHILTNNVDNYTLYKLIKDSLIKTEKITKPNYGIYIYINNLLSIDTLQNTNKTLNYVKSIQNGKFYNNNLSIVYQKDYGDLTDIFVNFEKTTTDMT
jgi:hypothetical protein